MSQSASQHDRLGSIQQRALIAGGVGVIILLAGVFINRESFFQGYLLGYLFWQQLALGCLAAVMLHHIVGGRWGFVPRRILETGAMTLPVLLIPVRPGSITSSFIPDPMQRRRLENHGRPNSSDSSRPAQRQRRPDSL